MSLCVDCKHCVIILQSELADFVSYKHRIRKKLGKESALCYFMTPTENEDEIDNNCDVVDIFFDDSMCNKFQKDVPDYIKLWAEKLDKNGL